MFTIDNNQNPDYMDLSWLVIDQQVASPLNGNSYILAQFDYFSTTGSGFLCDPLLYPDVERRSAPDQRPDSVG